MAKYRVIITTYAPEKFGYDVMAYSHEQAAGKALRNLNRACGEVVEFREVEVKKISEG